MSRRWTGSPTSSQSFNKTWGGTFSEPERVAEILNRMPDQVLEDEAYRNARTNSDRQKRPDRTRLGGETAGHRDGEMPDGALQGLHRGCGLPGMAQLGDVPGDVPNRPLILLPRPSTSPLPPTGKAWTLG